MKKIILSLAFFSLLLSFRIAFADVVINEIMYNPTDGSGHEWIEIFNDSDEQINLDGWRFFNNESSSAPIRTTGSYILEPHNYALLISNNSQVSFSGQIFTSSDFSLPNDSSKYNTYKGIFSDKNKTQGNSVKYNTGLGANGDGNSLQKTSSGWISATPTPGEANESVDTSSDSSSSSGEDTDSDTITVVKKKTETKKEKVVEIPTIKAKILTNNPAFAGQPLKLKTNVLGYSNENLVLGKAYWNFGDGKSFEQINNFEEFNHIYYYPGEYALVLEYYQNNFSKTPDVVARMTIKVIPTTVVISKVGDAKDFFVELTNSATSDIDISNWYLKTNNKSFVFSRNSVILAKKQMTVSGLITGFRYGDQFDLKLFSATNELIFDYNNQNLQENNIQNKKIIRNENNFVQPKEEISKTGDLNLKENKISAESLGVSPVLSEEDDAENNKNKSYLFFWGFVVLLVVACVGVYYVRQRKNVSLDGDDFDIVDE